MFATLAAAWVLTAAPGTLGTPLRQDGYTLRPPEGFRLAQMRLFSGTRAGAVALDPGADRYLSAALADGEGPDAAAMLVAIVHESFEATLSSRDDFTTQAMKHFADELGMPLSLVRTERIQRAPQRVEVLATLKQQDQLRTLLIASLEGEGRHAVITFSVPSARFEELWPGLQASLDSFRAEGGEGPPVPEPVLAAILVALGLALFASFALWRRRRRLRRADQGLVA